MTCWRRCLLLRTRCLTHTGDNMTQPASLIPVSTSSRRYTTRLMDKTSHASSGWVVWQALESPRLRERWPLSTQRRDPLGPASFSQEAAGMLAMLASLSQASQCNLLTTYWLWSVMFATLLPSVATSQASLSATSGAILFLDYYRSSTARTAMSCVSLWLMHLMSVRMRTTSVSFWNS
jgi:hypothetical protein